MRSFELQDIVEAAGYTFELDCNEYNEEIYKVIIKNKLAYKSYNPYCIVAFIKGCQYAV